ncbi:MAG: hypothetical protein WBW04_02265, partial [Nitrolancea sp.]
MGILFALVSAIFYGTCDFAAGIASRRVSYRLVTVAVQAFGLLAAGIGVLLFSGTGPTEAVLIWGAASGVGSALGTTALYRGFAVGRMSVVAPLSAVLAAVLPVALGVSFGDHLSTPALVGIFLAIPAIGLVSLQQDSGESSAGRAGFLEGIVAGIGFALLFVALDRAGTSAGAWPLIPGQTVSLLLVLPFVRGVSVSSSGWRSAAAPMVVAGLLSGAANLAFLAATGHGALAIVAVLASL